MGKFRKEGEKKIILDLGGFKDRSPELTALNIQKGADIICDLSLNIPFKDKSVDIIISNHLIEHLAHKNVIVLFKEIYRVLKWNGLVTLITPDFYSICLDYLNGLILEVVMEEIFSVNQHKYERHLSIYDFKTMGKYLIKVGFPEKGIVWEIPGTEFGHFYKDCYEKKVEIRKIEELSFCGEVYMSNRTVQITAVKIP